MKIVVGDFLRETFLSKNPQITEDDLLLRTNLAFYSAGGVRDGYRDGVLLVSLGDVSGFKRRVRKLEKGDYLFGKYVPRVEGETPRKKVGVLHVGDLPDAKAVDVVLYHKDVLNETEPMERYYDYEIVAVLGKESHADEPMDTETLMHNHFKSDGGSDTKMTNDEFVEALRKSHEYWKDKAHIH